jgi:hypothetical protein
MTTGTGEEATICQAAIVIGDGGPSPGPDPPPPVPVVGKLHVLILYESGDDKEGSLTSEQSGVTTSVLLRRYLESHCVSVEGEPEYRFLDVDADIDGMSDAWRTQIEYARQAGKGNFPWLTIDVENGGRYDGPMPADVDATLVMLKQYGGE